MLVFNELPELPGKHALGRNLTGLFETTFLSEKVFQARTDVFLVDHFFHRSSV